MTQSCCPWLLAGILWGAGLIAPARGAELTIDAARAALLKATDFFRTHCSAGGGYVYRVSSDLQLRQGELPVGPTTAWIQPPATPAVGQAYLDAYRLTREKVLLEAARETAQALLRGQLVSGGWDDRIEFAPADRARFAYRVDRGTSSPGPRQSNSTTFDDNKSQSAVRFLMQLDRELGFQDAALHEATTYALRAFVSAQYPNGAWPQRYSSPYDPAEFPVLKASLPDDWPREYPGVRYQSYYTLNDGTICDLILTMLDAWDVYQDAVYLSAAQRGGDFFLLAQLPDPQPGWAQQYDRQMHPAWARKFEPPAVTGGESQRVMQTLLLLYRRTGEAKYLEPLPRALSYYRKSLRPDGRLARFYELHTNRPLYFTKDYQLTYSDDDLPTHYAFIQSSRLDQIEADYQRVLETPRDKLWTPRNPQPPRLSPRLTDQAAEAVAGLDPRGAWVEPGRIKTPGGGEVQTEVIDSATFAQRLRTLAEFIAARR
jgi:hypothetical protein